MVLYRKYVYQWFYTRGVLYSVHIPVGFTGGTGILHWFCTGGIPMVLHPKYTVLTVLYQSPEVYQWFYTKGLLMVTAYVYQCFCTGGILYLWIYTVEVQQWFYTRGPNDHQNLI